VLKIFPLTLTLPALSFTFIPGACSLQLRHSSALRRTIGTRTIQNQQDGMSKE